MPLKASTARIASYAPWELNATGDHLGNVIGERFELFVVQQEQKNEEPGRNCKSKPKWSRLRGRQERECNGDRRNEEVQDDKQVTSPTFTGHDCAQQRGQPKKSDNERSQ